MKFMRVNLPRRYHRYLPVLIFSGLSIGLLAIRMIGLANTRFLFLAWNLFLAWLPLLWAEMLRRGLDRQRWLSLRNAFFSFLWLIFLPNSFYLVTDFIHLRNTASSTLLYDAVMFMSFAVAGILLGCMSMYIIHRELAKRLARDMTWAFLLSFIFLSSIAIYLGRYLGWNSWDVVLNPVFILLDLSVRLTSSQGLKVTVGTSLLFFMFITAAYASFYSAIRTLKFK